MQIYWYGHSCFKIIAKTDKEETIIITDPYNDLTGLRQQKFMADIVTLNNIISPELDIEAVKEKPFIIDKPGEYEIKNIYIRGLSASQDKTNGSERGLTTMYLITAENMTIAHLGFLGEELTSSQLELLEGVDILLLPVGNPLGISYKEAVKIISLIEPRIVVPMMYQIPDLILQSTPIEKFCSEAGVSVVTKEEKLKISKKDILSMESKIIILEKS